MQCRSLGWEDPLGKKMVTHSSILAWKIPWTEDWWAIVNEVTESDMTEHLATSEYVWFASVEYFPAS